MFSVFTDFLCRIIFIVIIVVGGVIFFIIFKQKKKTGRHVVDPFLYILRRCFFYVDPLKGTIMLSGRGIYTCSLTYTFIQPLILYSLVIIHYSWFFLESNMVMVDLLLLRIKNFSVRIDLRNKNLLNLGKIKHRQNYNNQRFPVSRNNEGNRKRGVYKCVWGVWEQNISNYNNLLFFISHFITGNF